MLYVSIVVELLRARPAAAVWLAALMQAALWMVVPALFYSAPPGDLPAVLAVGHEFGFSTDLGPPVLRCRSRADSSLRFPCARPNAPTISETQAMPNPKRIML